MWLPVLTTLDPCDFVAAAADGLERYYDGCEGWVDWVWETEQECDESELPIPYVWYDQLCFGLEMVAEVTRCLDTGERGT